MCKILLLVRPLKIDPLPVARPIARPHLRMSKRMLGLDKVQPKKPWWRSGLSRGAGLYVGVAAVGALAGAVAAVYKFREMGDLPTSATA